MPMPRSASLRALACEPLTGHSQAVAFVVAVSALTSREPGRRENMDRPRRAPRARLGLAVALAASLAASIGPVAPGVLADTGGTDTIKVLPGTTTINPIGTGGSFSVNLVGNGSVPISG